MKSMEKIFDSETYLRYARMNFYEKRYTAETIYLRILDAIDKWPSCYFVFEGFIREMNYRVPNRPVVHHQIQPFVYMW